MRLLRCQVDFYYGENSLTIPQQPTWYQYTYSMGRKIMSRVSGNDGLSSLKSTDPSC